MDGQHNGQKRDKRINKTLCRKKYRFGNTNCT